MCLPNAERRTTEAKPVEICRSDIGRTHGSAPTIGRLRHFRNLNCLLFLLQNYGIKLKMPRQNGKNVGQNGKKCTEDRCSTKYRITGDRYIGSLFRVDEPFPMIRRRTVIFLVRVATQSIPKKKAKKIPQGWLPCGTRWSNTLEECYACNFFFSLRFSIYR